MAKNLREDVFLGTDNSFTLNISVIDGDPVDFTSVTKMKLWLGDECSYEISSLAYPSAFDWVNPPLNTPGNIKFVLGKAAEALAIPVGSYVTRLKMFSSTYHNGIVIVDKDGRDYRLRIKVLASCET